MSFESHSKSTAYKSSLSEEEREKQWLRIFNKPKFKELYSKEYQELYGSNRETKKGSSGAN